MNEFNSNTVLTTLRKVIHILETEHIDYRLIGSIIAASINGKLHRNLGDIDLIIDEKKKEILFNELKKIGYFPVGGMYEFARKYMALETLRHKSYLEVGYFHGYWQKDGSILIGKGLIKVSIDPQAVASNHYYLDGIKFIGINPKAAATRIQASRANPKRKVELQFFKNKGFVPFPDTFVHIYILGIRCDWIYHLFSTLQNIIGFIRIKFGLSFDPWR